MRKILKYTLWVVAALILLPLLAGLILYKSADMEEPSLKLDTANFKVVRDSLGLRCGDSHLQQNSAGLWELYAAGDAETRGTEVGALTRDLMRYQEDVFVHQIHQYVPSDRYLGFLRWMTVIYNRRLGRHISDEYRTEIAAMARYCTHDYDAIGTPYERQLNYHAAHDIGHMMQQYMLVGCSSFGVWGDRSSDDKLLIGRNFDFYVGDDFARNKIVLFCAPEQGHKYASVTWAGMTGVLSGMNECGLTVTLNALKGSIPLSSATPVSLLAREILQYASNIDEACRIAASRKTFVSESYLIGSAADGRAAVIEKRPDEMTLYDPQSGRVICTNHFQSARYARTATNLENMARSDSRARWMRADELIGQYAPLTPMRAAEILRNTKGVGGADVGVGNELALNQSIAHHAVIFRPADRLMWVSTAPWQSGRMLCYDLRRIFATGRIETVDSLEIPADSAFLQRDLPRVLAFRKGVEQIRQAIKGHTTLEKTTLDAFAATNPGHYYTFRLLGDYYATRGDRKTACEMYRKALLRPIPYRSDREAIEKELKKS